MNDRCVTRETSASARPRRRLKPEVAARFASAQHVDLGELYSKPVTELTDRELGRMKAAFLRGE
jgi:hypothetical protein